MKNEEKIKELRTKSLSEKDKSNFKKSLLGGFNPDEVNEYIESLKKSHQQAINAYQERIDEFTTFNEMLTKEKDEIDNENKNLRDHIAQIDEKEETEKKKNPENDVKEENDLLKEELKDITNQRNELAREISLLKANVKNLEIQTQRLSDDNKNKSMEISKIYSEKRKLNSKIKLTAAEYIQEQSFSYGKIAEELSILLNKIENMSSETDEFKDNISDLVND